MILFDQLSIQPLLQVYTLKDRAPTYGGQNFSSTVDFVDLMLQSGRAVAWYPETNYW